MQRGTLYFFWNAFEMSARSLLLRVFLMKFKSQLDNLAYEWKDYLYIFLFVCISLYILIDFYEKTWDAEEPCLFISI